MRQSVEKCPHNEIAGSPGGALQVRNASEDTETRGDGLMKSGGRSFTGSNHAPVEIRRPLSARPRLVRTKQQGPGKFFSAPTGGGLFKGPARRACPVVVCGQGGYFIVTRREGTSKMTHFPADGVGTGHIPGSTVVFCQRNPHNINLSG